ncbi:MAG: CU044_2847 family protein [Cyanobacteriota bacterium]|jgi:hypothetical protein|nr:CU044_2847 family protein [Cyanobacteriota bacterium]
MTELIAIRLEDGSEIYMEATENVVVSEGSRAEPQPETETTRTAKGLTWGTAQSPAESAKALNFKALEGTIRTYTNCTMNAFKDLASANVNKVVLEFGLQVGGEAGVPYVTKGTASSNLRITVECSFN